MFQEQIQFIKDSNDNDYNKIVSIRNLFKNDKLATVIKKLVIMESIDFFKQEKPNRSIRNADILKKIPQIISAKPEFTQYISEEDVIKFFKLLRFNQDVKNFRDLPKKNTILQSVAIQDKVESFLSGIWVQGNKTTFN